jgi:putative acetyltransferase
MITVARTDPRDPQATALLQSSHALMQSLFPPEDNFYLSIGDLCADHIHFFTAREGDTILGTGALAVKDDYAEIKSMFVSEVARGRGVGDAIMRALEDHAKTEFVRHLKLETGNLLQAAQRMYARHGFTMCGPFGDYTHAASSVFMEKTL